MIRYTVTQNDHDLLGILALQKNNLPAVLAPEEKSEQGFVTVMHTLPALQKMHSLEPSVIAKDEAQVIAYLLAMTPASRMDLPILLPMFDIFGSVIYRDKTISSYNYLVVGQVCVDKKYRGQGILDKCYDTYKHRFKEKYDFAITEISAENTRSLKAHERIGFRKVHEYAGPDETQWMIVIWDWR